MKKVVIYFGLFAVLSSCFEQGDCTDVSSNQLKIGFYDFGTKAPKTIALESITTDVDGSSLILYQGQSVSAVTLPLHPNLDTMTFNFHFGSAVTVLEIQYRVRTFNLSPECKAISLYSITEATSESLYQITYTQKGIAKNVPENLKLFF